MMARIKNNLCPHCSGRGFKWEVGKILSRRDGSEVATTYKQGPDCEHCHGTGQVDLQLTLWGWIVLGVMALVLSAFVIQPLIKLWLD